MSKYEESAKTVIQYLLLEGRAEETKAMKHIIDTGAELLEALREIAKGEGVLSRDALTSALDVIANLRGIANRAIARATGKE